MCVVEFLHATSTGMAGARPSGGGVSTRGGQKWRSTELELVSEALLPCLATLQASHSLEETRLAAWWAVSCGQWAVGSGHLATVLHTSLRCARDPATQRPSNSETGSSLQPPTSSLRQSSSLPLLSPSARRPTLAFAEFFALELGGCPYRCC